MAATDMLLQIGIQATAGAAISEFIELNKQIEATHLALVQTTGSSEAAAAAIEHIARLANRTGQLTSVLAKQFVDLSAAAKGTALEGGMASEVFDTVAAAMGSLGKDSATTERAFTALSQMMAKGVVSAEEWRGQLAEALPSANAALQKATGLSTQELNALMESGQLLAVDVLPALVRGLKMLGTDTTKEVDSLSASLNRLKNSLVDAFARVGEAGTNDVIKGTVDNFTLAVKALTYASGDASDSIERVNATMKQAGTDWWIPGMATTALTNALKSYVQQHEPVAQATSATTEALGALAAASIQAAAHAAQLSDQAAKNTESVKAQGTAALAAANANLELARLGGDAADILASQAASADAMATASANLAAAKAGEVAATQHGIDVLRESVYQLELEREANAGNAEQINTLIEAKGLEIDKREQALSKLKAESDGLASSAEQQRLAAEASRLAATTYGDQSQQVGELAGAYASALAAMQALTASQEEGARAAVALVAEQSRLDEITARYNQAMQDAVTGNRDASSAIAELGKQQAEAQAAVEKLKGKVEAGARADRDAAAAKERLKIAQARLTDAYADLIGASEEQLRQAERASRHLQADNSNRVESIRLLQRDAELRGDASSAIEYQAQALEAEADGIRQQIAAKQQELALAESLYQNKLKAAQQDGEVTQQEQESLNTSKDIVQTKRDEIDALELSADGKERDAQAARQMGDEADQAGKRVKGLSDQQNQAGGIAKHLADMLRAAKDSIGEYSQAARAALEDAISGVHSLSDNIRAIDSLDASKFADTDSIDQANDAIARLSAGLEAATDKARRFKDAQHGAFQYFAGMDAQLAAVARFEGRLIAAQLAAQRLALAEEQMGRQLDDVRRQFDDGGLSLAQYIAQLERMEVSYARLGDEKLEGLRSALASARREMQDFAGSAKEGLQSLQVEWAQLNNQQDEVLRLEYLQSQMKVQQQIAEAKAAGNDAAINSLEQQLALLDRIYRKKQDNLQADERASKAQDSASATGASASPAKTIRVVISEPSGKQAAVTADSEASADQFLTVLAKAGLRAL